MMLYALILVVISITVGIVAGIRERDVTEGILSWVASSLLGIFFMILSILVITEVCSYENTPELYEVVEEVNTYDLVGLQDNMTLHGSIHGSKYLFSGHLSGEISTSMAYAYMIKTDKGLKMCTLPCDSCYIVETDTDLPKVIIKSKVEYKVKSDFYRDWLWVDDFTDNRQSAIFYVPSGSVCYNYNIDLE